MSSWIHQHFKEKNKLHYIGQKIIIKKTITKNKKIKISVKK